MKTFKTRHQFYLPDDLSEKLEALTAAPGASKTTILTDALTAWLERKAGSELDQRFGPRLDRQSRAAERIERKVDALNEIVGLFVQHQLTLVAHQPAFYPETAQLGRVRYQRFMELVERRLGKTVEPERLPPANSKQPKT